ncbi:MAG: SIS domain-containing protein [Candidatus Margulisiibacteriota bacterium]|jgi:D-sedoheptulose 7-phosphate isomerase
MSTVKNQLNIAENIIKEFKESKANLDKLTELIELLTIKLRQNKKIYICGNGGSACDAMHFAEEFVGRFQKDRPPLPVLALTDPAGITCIGNDYGFDEIFARPLQAFGQEGDILILLSTSGNSMNLVRAQEVAKQKGLISIAFLGKDGGKLLNQVDHYILISAKTSDRIQEFHMFLLHIITEEVEKRIFPELVN